VSIGQSKLKLLSETEFLFFSNSDLDLNHRHLGSNPKLPLDISYPNSKFGVNRTKQTWPVDTKLAVLVAYIKMQLGIASQVSVIKVTVTKNRNSVSAQ